MPANNALTVVMSKCHQHGQLPTGPQVRQCLRDITQFLQRKPNHENTNGVGQAGLILPGARCIALSANDQACARPDDPPMAPPMVGLNAEQRSIAQCTNQQEWKHKEERDTAKAEALQLLLNAGTTDVHLRQF